MAARTLISVEEYLSTSYRPDCDYVDGEVLERNLGERDHAWVQMFVSSYILTHYHAQGFCPFTEFRLQVKPRRIRVPDICVTVGFPAEKILTQPPMLCVEILSPEDRLSRVKQRIQDYLEMGVPIVWVIDPDDRRAYTETLQDGFYEVTTGVLRTENPKIEFPLDAIFP